MKRLVYVLSKNKTIRNYVSNVEVTPDENGETYNVELLFTTDRDKAIDLEDAANDIYNHLVSRMSDDLVGIMYVDYCALH